MRVPTAGWAFPLVGHGAQLFCRPLQFIASLNALGPVVRITTGVTPVYMITSPDLLRRVLVTDTRNYVRGRFSTPGHCRRPATPGLHARFRFEAEPGSRVRPHVRIFLRPGAVSMTLQSRC